MIYKFIDDKGSFQVRNPHKYELYFPLTNAKGNLLSSISPNLAGDIKADNNRFLMPPASAVDLRTNLLCRRDFFIKLGSKTIRLSDPYPGSLECGFFFHELTKKIEGLEIKILNFVPCDAQAEVMQVTIKNCRPRKVKLTPTSFIPLYGRSADNLRDHRHVSSLLNRIRLNKYGLVLKPSMSFDEAGHRENKTEYYCFGFEGNYRPPQGQFPALESFLGDGGLNFPEAIEKNLKPITKISAGLQGKETLGALRFKTKALKPGHNLTYTLVFGIGQPAKTFSRLNSKAKIKQSLARTKKYWQDTLSPVDFKFGNRNFDNWLKWVKAQPTLRKLFGCSFLPHFDYGKGGRGWRDLWQDALTLLINEPEKAKHLIINSFRGVRLDGTNATIINKNYSFKADRNKISRIWSDHGVWPWLTLKFYIEKTGDLAILNKKVSYFKNKSYQGTILEHILIQHLTSFLNVGKHNVIRLENADWNDGLDMAPEKGESVTFSFMYADNLAGIADILKRLKAKKVRLLRETLILLETVNYNQPGEKQKKLNKYRKSLKTSRGKTKDINLGRLISDLSQKSAQMKTWLNKHEWLKEGFFNGYYDNKGRRVAGKRGKKIRMMLSAQVFSLMSKTADKGQAKKSWAAVNKYLKSKALGGYRLNTDFGGTYLDLGRLFGFSYGDKENGAFFNHMNVMFANSLYKNGLIKEGSTAFNSLYKMSASDKALIYPCLPEYFNSRGQGLYSYLTGSASWYIYTLIQEILGIKFKAGGLLLAPKLLPGNFFGKSISLTFPWAGKKVCLTYIKGEGTLPCRIKKVLSDKKEINQTHGNWLIEKKDLRGGGKIALEVYLV